VPTSIGTNRGTSALSASFLHINSRGFLLCDFLVARAIPLYSFTVTGMGARSPTNEEMNQRNSVFLALVMNSYLREGRRPRDPDRLERKRANELKHRARVCVECGVFPLFLTKSDRSGLRLVRRPAERLLRLRELHKEDLHTHAHTHTHTHTQTNTEGTHKLTQNIDVYIEHKDRYT
jgi:hypothetical protein